jgi:hypothetical protein
VAVVTAALLGGADVIMVDAAAAAEATFTKADRRRGVN